jgi:NADH:ubiquinone oxidoreductase subunit B-like Fe-S oxidoreductase
MIFQIGPDILVYGHSSMVLVVFSSNLPHWLVHKFDFDRYNLIPRSSPRQVDLIITVGTITMKMAPSLVRLY